eukprot:2129837-Amphidinium_carterae.1
MQVASTLGSFLAQHSMPPSSFARPPLVKRLGHDLKRLICVSESSPLSLISHDLSLAEGHDRPSYRQPYWS